MLGGTEILSRRFPGTSSPSVHRKGDFIRFVRLTLSGHHLYGQTNDSMTMHFKNLEFETLDFERLALIGKSPQVRKHISGDGVIVPLR